VADRLADSQEGLSAMELLNYCLGSLLFMVKAQAFTVCLPLLMMFADPGLWPSKWGF
jgi:hypothetical protein